MGQLDPQGAAAARAAAQLDLAAPRCEALFAPPGPLDRALRRLLEDPRDGPILHLIFNLLVVTVPSAALLFAARPSSHWLGALYLVANYVLFLQRFMLTLHFSEHRRLFKKGGLGLGGRCLAAASALHAWLLGASPSGLWLRSLTPLRTPTLSCPPEADCGLLNLVVPVLLAPFFGVPSGMYRLHHCVMHHVENNGVGRDLSSTEPYQRDNFLHFLQ